MKILGIESSCDETAAAVVEDGQRLLSSIVESQIELHRVYGGVVPEIASRSHLEVIIPVVETALKQADCNWEEIDAIAVTHGPGLSGSLLIGTLTARTLAWLQNKPLIGINHVLAHVYANFLTKDDRTGAKMPLPAKAPDFPLLALIVSGGHTQLVYFRHHFDYQLLGQTSDDAVGEAFDKVAKMLGLPYPGGPAIAKLAIQGNPKAFKLPGVTRTSGSSPAVTGLGEYDFSFSGLKTAVLRALQSHIGESYSFPSHELAGRLDEATKADMAASFQARAVSELVGRLERAVANYSPATVVIAGGVAANQALREAINQRLSQTVDYVPAELCTDNAAMVATLAYFAHKHGFIAKPLDLVVEPSLVM